MDTIETTMTEYRSALEENAKLSQQETIIKQQRLAAQNRLSMVKDQLRALELEITSNINSKTI